MQAVILENKFECLFGSPAYTVQHSLNITQKKSLLDKPKLISEQHQA